MSWRKLEKGQIASTSRKQALEEARFKVGGYVRISPTNEEREEGSLVSHPQRIKNFVEDKNRREVWGEIIEWYVDKDYSGKDTNRPAFQKMLADIANGKINAVVVTELSRLSRSVKDFCDLYEFFKQHKIAFFSLRESFDTSTPSGELMLMQSIAFAQFERHTIVDRIRRGARARAERGLGNGHVALGFRLVEHKPNHREIDENEKLYVEMIFKKMLELKRLSKVVHFLNENGHHTKEFITKDGRKVGGNRWTIASLHALLTNRAYIGQREFNKRHRSVDPTELKEDERYFYVDAQWPALISKDIFDDVQSLLERNKSKARRYVHIYRLTGLLRCSECGHPLVGKSGTGKNGKYFYYGHMRKMTATDDRHLHRCAIETVSAIKVEEAVIARLKELANDRALVEALARNTVREQQQQFEHERKLLVVQESEVRKLRQKVDNLMEAIAEESDKTVRAGLTGKLRELQAQFERSEAVVIELRGRSSEGGNVADVSSVFALLKAFKTGFELVDVSLQAEVLRDVVAEIEVQKEGVLVKIFGISGGNLTKKRPAMCRSSVRTVSNLVDPTRVELVTYPCHGYMIPTSPWALTIKKQSTLPRLKINPIYRHFLICVGYCEFAISSM